MSGKRPRKQAYSAHPHTLTTGVAVSGYDQGKPESMQVTAPGFLPRIKASSPPDYHTWLGEEQEMAILAMLVRGLRA